MRWRYHIIAASFAFILAITAALALADSMPGAPSPEIQIRGRNFSNAERAPYDVIVDGVDTRTRNYTYSTTDLTLPDTIGPKICLNRVFNANDDREGPFGIGWSIDFQIPHQPGQSQPTTLTDHHGNYSIVLKWNFSDPQHPRIVSASSYQLRPVRKLLQSVVYSYAQGFDRSVSSYTSPGGKVTTYGYHHWKSPSSPAKEQDLLSRIIDADGVLTQIVYNDTVDDVEVAQIINPVGSPIEFIPSAIIDGASGTYIITRHTQDLPVKSEGSVARTVFYVPDKSSVWVVSGWHSKGVERRFDLASGLLQEEDYCAGFDWSHRVPAKILAAPCTDMDYDDRYHFWTLVDMMHAVFWQDIFSPGVPGTQLLNGGIVYLRKTYSYDDAGRLTASVATGFPFTPDQSLPTTGSQLLRYSRYPVHVDAGTRANTHRKSGDVRIYDALGRVVRETITQTVNGKKTLKTDTLTTYQHRGTDTLASDGEIAQSQHFGPGGHLDETVRYEYTGGGRIARIWDRKASGPLVCRSIQYERRNGSMTGRVVATKLAQNGILRYALSYNYGGFDAEDLTRKTLTIFDRNPATPEVWRWDYGNYFSSPDLSMRRIPSRIVQYAPPAAKAPVQAVDYLYDSCLGELGLVRFAVKDTNPAELEDRSLQDQNPKQFVFQWYEHDSFGRVFDMRLYRGQARVPIGYQYSLLARVEYFRLKSDKDNLSGFDPRSFTPQTSPYDLAGNIRYRRVIDYDNRLRLFKGLSSGLTGCPEQMPWSPADMTEAPIKMLRFDSTNGDYKEIIEQSGMLLMVREYNRRGRLIRARTSLLGARGIEAVTEYDGTSGANTIWTEDDGQGRSVQMSRP